MRVWRALKESGCGVLRDGVYVLPLNSAGGAVLTKMESEIRAAGGSAMTVELKPKTAADLARVRRLFDRDAAYGVLVQEIGVAKSALPRLPLGKARATVQRLQRSFVRLSEIDFFPGQAKLQAADAISDLERTLEEAYPRGEPHPSKKQLRRLDRAAYKNRLWATRKDLWVDRLASAWLIKRFIDRDARFVWIDSPRQRPKRAVGFDFDEAQFTHTDNRVTFEVLVSSFGLDDDPALSAIGAAVHFLDIGGIPVADAKGLETLLRGAKQAARTDDTLLAEASRILDMFYSAYARGRKQSLSRGTTSPGVRANAAV